MLALHARPIFKLLARLLPGIVLYSVQLLLLNYDYTNTRHSMCKFIEDASVIICTMYPNRDKERENELINEDTE